MLDQTQGKNTTIILGGGLTGLSAGFFLTKAGFKIKVFERDSTVGGLSKTIVHKGYRFDLGGHRFFTKDEKIDRFVRELMDDELLAVYRTSKIFMRGNFFDYPLKPVNAMSGLGIPATLKIIIDYGAEKIKMMLNQKNIVSLEDWVVSNFGRTMFNIYFKEYSEKVWGIECSRISAEWVAQRIKGLSLAKAVKNAFFKFTGKNIPTLADSFVYPQLGIGRISDRLSEEIGKSGDVFTGSPVTQINHAGSKIVSVVIQNHNGPAVRYGDEFISSIPLNKTIQMLNPLPPDDILEKASKLQFRDLVVVAVMVDRNRVTDQTWIYIPEKKIPFGRIHEPKNWSEKMAPQGKTLIVMEYFSFMGDEIWNKTDAELIDITVDNLDAIGFLKRHEATEGIVVRVPKAYPLFEIGYKEICDEMYSYLDRFRNFHISGRSGMFRYYNMDHAIESGMDTAEKIIQNSTQNVEFRSQNEVFV